MSIRLFAAASLLVLTAAAATGGAEARRSAALSGAVMDCGGCDVSAVGVDGRGDRLLLSNQGLRGWDLFDLSPDRRGVVFSKDPHLYVAHTTGRGKRTLASGYINYARWSPDGRMIAYGLNETHSCSGESLWVINADGSDPHQVADCAMQISWSPDSRRLAFASYSGPNTNGRVAVVNADGSGYRTVSTPGVEIFDVTWALRGDWIAYDLLSTQGTVHVVRADGREEDTVGSGVFGGWSPDGRRIAYVHIDRTGSGKNAGRSSIRVMNRDGKRGRVLVRGLVGYSIAWSRNDGSHTCGRREATATAARGSTRFRRAAEDRTRCPPLKSTPSLGRSTGPGTAGASSISTWFSQESKTLAPCPRLTAADRAKLWSRCARSGDIAELNVILGVVVASGE